jgi:hypothetical protein
VKSDKKRTALMAEEKMINEQLEKSGGHELNERLKVVSEGVRVLLGFNGCCWGIVIICGLYGMFWE